MAERVKVAVGLGCQRGVSLATLEQAVDDSLQPLGAVEVCCLASHVRKADEPALRQLAEVRGWPLRLYPAERLAAVQVPNPSARVADEVGTPSVAEAAALLAAGSRTLLAGKQRHYGTDGKGVAVAVARCGPAE